MNACLLPDPLRRQDEHVKLLRLSDSGIRVASYLTELPPRKLSERKLRAAIQIARQRLAQSPTEA